MSCTGVKQSGTLTSKGGRMNQKKTGAFFKELRKEKKLTQEQVSVRLNVSNRTVSRWETGSTMPDLDVLMQMADFYEVDLRELLEGERREERMNPELEKIVLKVADFSTTEKQKANRRMHWIFIAGLAAFILYFAMLIVNDGKESNLFDFVQGLSLGIACSTTILGVITTSRNAAKIRTFKMRLLHRSNYQGTV